MLLINELQRILDLSDVIGEADRKLKGTQMFVNGELTNILGFDYDNGHIITRSDETGDKISVKVKTLEVWLPESGIYVTPAGSVFLLQKIPRRQWKKSFSSDFYAVEETSTKNGIRYPEKDPLRAISKAQRKDIYVNNVREILWWNKLIGYVKDSNTIMCTNSLFKQELYDWSRDA